MNALDCALNPEFLAQIPTTPGVYCIYDVNGVVIYVGKAINLRRRVGQYRNVKRRRAHRRMRRITQHAVRLEYELCDSELAALLRENALIQEHHPRWNQASAFHFLYPLIGIQQRAKTMAFCYTTHPEMFAGYDFHGAFRSREITQEAFFGLMKLLRFVVHPTQPDTLGTLPRYSYRYAFRQVPAEWPGLWGQFFRGQQREALEHLVMRLVDNAGARHQGPLVQEGLNQLHRFFQHEAIPLARVIHHTQHPEYPVSQRDRDRLFLQFRHRERETLCLRPPCSTSV